MPSASAPAGIARKTDVNPSNRTLDGSSGRTWTAPAPCARTFDRKATLLFSTRLPLGLLLGWLPLGLLLGWLPLGLLLGWLALGLLLGWLALGLLLGWLALGLLLGSLTLGFLLRWFSLSGFPLRLLLCHANSYRGSSPSTLMLPSPSAGTPEDRPRATIAPTRSPEDLLESMRGDDALAQVGSRKVPVGTRRDKSEIVRA